MYPSLLFVLTSLKSILSLLVNIVAHEVENPNWPQANQLAICKRDQGVELVIWITIPAP